MARGFEKPPIWATVVIIASIVGLAVLLPVALTRTETMPAAANTARATDASATPRPSPDVAEVQAAFFGDSYTAGAGSTDPANRFTTLVARDQGWTETNLGQGGTGYVTPVTGDTAVVACGLDRCPSYAESIPALAGVDPGIIVVSGGRNEVGAAAAPDYTAEVARFFAELRAAHPVATIIAISPLWDDDPAPPGLADVAVAVQAGVEAVGGSYLNVGQPFADEPSLISDDGVHPNDDGHAALARAIENQLAAAGIN